MGAVPFFAEATKGRPAGRPVLRSLCEGRGRPTLPLRPVAANRAGQGARGFLPLRGDEAFFGVMDSVRVDKWMWAVRLFKTRGLAAKACESGRVRTGERIFKAASELKGGELLELPFPEGPGTRVVRVLGLIDKRVGAPIAVECFVDHSPPPPPPDMSAPLLTRDRATGRPTKKDRRQIDRFRRG